MLQVATQLSRKTRRLPVGAEPQTDGSTAFRVWAPRPQDLSLVVEGRDRVEIPLDRDGRGYAAVVVEGVGAGSRYWYRLDGTLRPDPASRFQPEGPFGPSEVIDPGRHRWRDAGWSGLALEGQVIYELHVGTFTGPGTWAAAVERLPDLQRLGVTAVEVMPVAEFPGRFGWGYDGVFPFAPTRLYGTPEDFRGFVDAAHAAGLGVLLDVVYNHLGPSGCVHREYAESYFARHGTEWGDAINFDGPDAGAVREYIIANAGYWIDEFHLDGLRLAAVHSIADASSDHIVTALTRQARAAAGHRSILVIAENERQQTHFLRVPLEQGGLDAAWNDDFHHSAVVAVTGRREAYYSDHAGRPQEFISAAKYGHLFQGQRYAWQKQPRGSRADGIRPAAFVTFVENHDQLANTGNGSHLHRHTSGAQYRALIGMFLLLPSTPMLFQGQEFGASSPFLYFADHEGDLAAAVLKGRAEFVRQFPALATPEAQAALPVPHDPATFERCKLRWEEHRANHTHRRLYEDLLALRRQDLAFRGQQSGAFDGAVIADAAFVLRFGGATPEDERLVVVNLGRDLVCGSFAEPLVAPPEGRSWAMHWSSESVAYGGLGAYDIVTASGWRIPGGSTTVLRPAFAQGALAGKPEVAQYGPEARDGGSRSD